MSDLISRQAAIDYCYALINAENPSDPSDEWNYSQERINQTEVILHHLEQLPSAQPIDVQEAYYRGKIDGIKECTAKIKKVNEEIANERLNQQAGGDSMGKN